MFQEESHDDTERWFCSVLVKLLVFCRVVRLRPMRGVALETLSIKRKHVVLEDA